MPRKRVRLLAMSRSGCVTCKYMNTLAGLSRVLCAKLTSRSRHRHIKCDEERPACLRCDRSGLECGGYIDSRESTITLRNPVRTQTSPERVPLGDPGSSLASTCIRNNLHYRYLTLGLECLQSGTLYKVGGPGRAIRCLVPVFSLSNNSVSILAAAIGSAYELEALTITSVPRNEEVAFDWYHRALRSIRQDLSSQPKELLPLILSCLMLSVVELLLQQESSALHHLAGARWLLHHRRAHRVSTSPLLDTSFCDERAEDDIAAMFRLVDLQTCSFARSKPPRTRSVAPLSTYIAPLRFGTYSSHGCRAGTRLLFVRADGTATKI